MKKYYRIINQESIEDYSLFVVPPDEETIKNLMKVFKGCVVEEITKEQYDFYDRGMYHPM